VMYKAEEILYQLKDCGAKTVITLDLFYPYFEKLRDALGIENIIVTNIKDFAARGYEPYESLKPFWAAPQSNAEGTTDFLEAVERRQPLDSVVPIQPEEDVAQIIYTAGTTGKSKGAMQTHLNLVHNSITHSLICKCTGRPINYSVLPMFHTGGFFLFPLPTLYRGGTVITVPIFDPEDALKLIQANKVNVLFGSPTLFVGLLRHPAFKDYDVSSVRLYTSGGDALGAETLKGWQELTGKPIWEGLGGTEMLHLVTSNTMNSEPVPDSIGKPLPGVQVRVIDESGTDCKPNEVGSMILKGASGTLYWKPYVDNERLLNSQKKGVVNGWNQMGDAVFMKEDGNICFVSREDDMIKSSGYRIGPAEVEEALEKHPAIAEAGVVGIPDPDKGQITKAFVVLKEGYEGSDEFFEDLKTFLKEHIAVYKLPRAIEYKESLPRTPTGKLLRRHLRPPKK
ncbi:MAG: AMP-binding protein, partial [Deltaproteobacteria bacterium]